MDFLITGMDGILLIGQKSTIDMQMVLFRDGFLNH